MFSTLSVIAFTSSRLKLIDKSSKHVLVANSSDRRPGPFGPGIEAGLERPALHVRRGYAYAAPTMIFRIRHGADPCDGWFDCTGCPLASPVRPWCSHVSGGPTASRFAQKSVVIAL